MSNVPEGFLCLNFLYKLLKSLCKENTRLSTFDVDRVLKDREKITMKLITKKTLKLIYFVIEFGKWTLSVPFAWNRKTNRILNVKSIWHFGWYLGLILSAVSTPIILYGYIGFLLERGFSFTDRRNAFNVVCLGGSLLKNIVHLNIYVHRLDIIESINKGLELYLQLQAKYSKGIRPWKFKIKRWWFTQLDLVLFFFAYLFVWFPIFLGVVGLIVPKYHIYSQTFPSITSSELLNGHNGIFIRLGLAMFQWIYIAQGYGATVATFLALYPHWYLGKQIGMALRKQIQEVTKEEWEDFKITYRSLQLNQDLVNNSFGYFVMPGYILVAMAILMFTANCLLTDSLEDEQPLLSQTFFIVYILGCFFLYYGVFDKGWQLSEESNLVLKDTAANNLAFARDKFLASCRPLATWFGPFGNLDRDMYILVGEECNNYLIDSLLY